MNSVGRTMDGPFSLPVLYSGGLACDEQNSTEPAVSPINQYTTSTQRSEDLKLSKEVEQNRAIDNVKDRLASDKTSIPENDQTTFERKDRNSEEHHSDDSEVEGHVEKQLVDTVRIKTEPGSSPVVTSGYASKQRSPVPNEDIRSDEDDDLDDESIRDYDHRDNDKFGLESPSGNNNKHGTNYEQRYNERYNETYKPIREQYSRSEFKEKLRRGDLNSYEDDRRYENNTPEADRVNGTTFSPNRGPWAGFPITQPHRHNSVDRKAYEQRFLPTDNEYSDRMGSYDPTSYTNTIAAMLRRFDLPDGNSSNPYSAKFGGMPASRALTFQNGEPGDVRDQSSSLLSPRSNQHFTSNNLMSPLRPGKVGSNQYSCHICKFVGTTEEGFKEHMKCHFEHLCPECSYSSRTEGRLRRHMQDFHGSKPPAFDNSIARRNGAIKPKLIKCRHCPFETMIKEESWAHCRIHIKEGKELCCTRCEFVTEFKHHMEYHIRNHIGSKPHKCPKCQYECVNKSMLNSHMKSHTNVYRYRCATCSYATKYAHSLKIHLRKKKHQAAIVLNEDGSMPVDGMGNFDLLSKRGPPRGPRSMSKKSGHLETESGADISPNEMGDMYSPDITGQRELDSSFWLPPHSQQIINTSSPARVAIRNNIDSSPGRLLPFPPNTIDYNTRASFPDDRINASNARMNTPSMNHSNEYHKIKQLINAAHPSQVLSSVVHEQSNLSASLSSPMTCKVCCLTCNSLKDLSQHFMQMHPNEGHEVLASVGIYPEMVSALTWSNPILIEKFRRMEEEQNRITSQQFSKVSPRVSSEFSNDGSSYSAEDNRTNSYVTPRKAPFPEKHNLDSPVAIKIEAGTTKETPLDLSSAYPVFDRRMERKRMSEEEDEEFLSAPSSRNESPNVTSNGNVVRKRSRKGKACRVDVLNQESWEEEKINYTDPKADAPELNSSYQKSLKVPERALTEVPLTSVEAPLSRDGDEKKDGSNGEVDFATKVNSADSSTERIVSNEEEEPVVCSSKPDPKFHVCAHCNIGFRDSVMHTIHMGYHGYKDPFKCNMCGMRTNDRMEFFLHMAKVAHD